MTDKGERFPEAQSERETERLIGERERETRTQYSSFLAVAECKQPAPIICNIMHIWSITSTVFIVQKYLFLARFCKAVSLGLVWDLLKARLCSNTGKKQKK